MRGETGLAIGVREGDIIHDTYRIDSALGEGSMGVVFAAHHLPLDERVAIKFLLPSVVSDPEVVNRFKREARAAVKIKSEHVARIRDFGTLETGSPFLVMEYLEGEDLAVRLARNGPLDIEEAVELVLQAAEAVAEAHALGIVHRDLKPANLFCVWGEDDRPSIKVLDFGISKITRSGLFDSGLGVTKSSALVGSPFYMSPEQMESPRSVDATTDIWALGVILYELLTGNVPFNGASLPQVCIAVTTRPAPSLRRFRPEVRPELEAVVLRCLEKERQKRYPNIVEFATALGRFAPKRGLTSVRRISLTFRNASLPASAVTVPPPAPRGEPKTAPRQSWWIAAPRAIARRAALDITGVAAAGMLVALVALIWSRTGPAPIVSAREPEAIAPTSNPELSAASSERLSSAAQDFKPVGIDDLLSSTERERDPGATAEPSSPATSLIGNRPSARSPLSLPDDSGPSAPPLPATAKVSAATAPAPPSSQAPPATSANSCPLCGRQ